MSSDDRAALLVDVALEARRHQTAQDAFDDAALQVLGINRSDGRCMDVLDQHGRMSAGELARACDLSTAAITSLVDRMERAGFLRRVPDRVDRRRVVIELTDEARRRACEIWGPIAGEARSDLDRYTDDELRLIRDFLLSGRELLDSHVRRVRGLPVAGGSLEAARSAR